MQELFIRYKHQRTRFDLPHGWKLLTFATFKSRSGKIDVEGLTKRALNGPINSAPLRERVSPSDTVAILIEDPTRSSPKKAILKVLLEELHEAGIPEKNVSVIIALGTHRSLAPEELRSVYGEDVVDRYSVINHNCYAPDLAFIGKLSTGMPVKINRKVYEATFKIGIGSIFPHPMNGFGGGGKILFPGVANFEAILEHHLKYSFRGGSEMGRLKGNPFYEEVSALAMRGGLNFIINSVLDHDDMLFALVCGDPIEAHLAGVDICKRIVSKTFTKKADITVISSYPYTEGPQIVKPLAPASEITKKGGTIVLAADCTVPLPDVYVKSCERFRAQHADHLRDAVIELFDQNRRIMEGGAPELDMSMAQVMLAQDDFTVILVSEDIPSETAKRLGFLFARDLSQAFAMAATLYNEPEVHVVPSGGIILPVLQDTENP
jgi:nickel-dependent lactate racemase